MTESTRKTKSWDELTFADNFLFCKILESEPEICRQLLELLLHIEIDHLEVPQTEKTMQETIEAKSVRFDVYTKNDTGRFSTWRCRPPTQRTCPSVPAITRASSTWIIFQGARITQNSRTAT